jgi:hypothetical protein
MKTQQALHFSRQVQRISFRLISIFEKCFFNLTPPLYVKQTNYWHEACAIRTDLQIDACHIAYEPCNIILAPKSWILEENRCQ